MKYVYIFFISIAISFIFGSCSNNVHGQNNPLPNANIPIENINTYIKLKDTPALANSHKNDDTLTLQLMNLSDKTIVFPDNFGVRIYIKNNGNWSEIQNNFYNSGGNFTLPSENSFPGGLPVSVLPYTPDLSSPTNIRVIIIGRIGNDNGEQVATYLDVPLNP